MCFNTSSSSLSKLSLKLCLLPVLNSLLTEIIGVLAFGGVTTVLLLDEDDDDDNDGGIDDDDDDVVISKALLLRSAMGGFLSPSCAIEPLLVRHFAVGLVVVALLKSMADTSSFSDDCSLLTDTELLLLLLLFNNGFFKVSRFKFFVGGGNIAGFGCIGFKAELPVICGL